VLNQKSAVGISGCPTFSSRRERDFVKDLHRPQCTRQPSDSRKRQGHHSRQSVEIKTFTKVCQCYNAVTTPNEEFIGTRQAFLPGGPRTGAPGRHVIRGRAKYRLVDEQVRVYVAPPIEEIESSSVCTYFLWRARSIDTHPVEALCSHRQEAQAR